MNRQHEEFERLVALFERRIYNVALRLVSSRDEAADLTQETFVRAFRGWGSFRRESQAYTWLYRILVNLNSDRLARNAKRRDREVSFGVRETSERAIELADRDADPSRRAENRELRCVLASAIEGLPQGYRECIVLKDMEGLSYEEIADTMEITIEAVRSRLARARHQLRRRLAPYLST